MHNVGAKEAAELGVELARAALRRRPGTPWPSARPGLRPRPAPPEPEPRFPRVPGEPARAAGKHRGRSAVSVFSRFL